MLKMAVQPPPPTKRNKPADDEDRVADEELLSVIELAGRRAADAGLLPRLKGNKEEKDVMWKLKVRALAGGRGEGRIM